MKNKLLTISAITVLLIAGQTAMAGSGSDENWGSLDPHAINSPNAHQLDQDVSSIKASSIQVPQSDPRDGDINNKFYDSNPDPFSLDFMGDD